MTRSSFARIARFIRIRVSFKVVKAIKKEPQLFWIPLEYTIKAGFPQQRPSWPWYTRPCMTETPKHSQEEIRDMVINFLYNQRKAVFSTLDEDGLPTTAMMLFAIYVGTRSSSAKYANIQKNPIIALSVIEGASDPLKVVDIRGDASEVPAEELSDTLAFFKSKNPAKLFVEGADDFTMIKITPHFMRYLDATSGEGPQAIEF